MSTDSGPAHVRKKGRSPSFPSYPLDVAIERARTIWKREQRHAAPIGLLQSHFGYTPGTGPANLTIASLKKYGLLVDEGAGQDRVAKLTPLAIDIINSPEPEDSIRRAALMPPIHRELWEQFQGQLPSDANLLYELITRRNFTQSGARDFVAQFRKTIAYARLEPPGTSAAELVAQQEPQRSSAYPDFAVTNPVVERAGAADTPQAPVVPAQAGAGHAPNAMTIPIPLIGEAPVQIVGQFPISEQAWEQFLRVLEAMKPGLVRPPG